MDNELKQCSKCKGHKALDLFSNNKSSKDGKQHYCKSCHAARARAYREANPETVAATYRAYYKANPEQRMLWNAKKRAKNNNLEFNLSLEDIQIPERCPILGITLERGNTHTNRDSSPSLDKILPEKGYVKGNVQVISDLANRMKSNATFAQMVMLGKWAEPFTEKA
jgi:hypothetical protein